MMSDNTTYRSYLLRLWRRGQTRPSAWAVAIEDVRTGERRGFPDLDAALRFLDAQLAAEEAQPGMSPRQDDGSS
jgi:hypothetical protein